MAGWEGFSEEDLHRLKKDHLTESPGTGQAEEKPETLRKANINPGSKRTKPREKIRTKASTSKKDSSGKPRANETHLKENFGKTFEKPVEFDVENSFPECERSVIDSEAGENSKSKEKEGVNDKEENVPEIILEPERIQAIELSALQKMQQKQKEIEDQNKLKKAAIQETIKTRFKKTQAEAQVLKVVQQELAHLDSLLSADVAILRDTIDDATRDYHHAMKRYEQAEAEFVAAKIDLHRKSERKELLTEHLYAIIQQNEERKAKKLEDLMAKLNLSGRGEIQPVGKCTVQDECKMTSPNTAKNENEVKTLKVNEKKKCETNEKCAGEVKNGNEKEVDTEVNANENGRKTVQGIDIEENGMK